MQQFLHDLLHQLGWLFCYIALAIFQSYHDLEVGDNKAARPGIKPKTSCSASQKRNHYTNTAPTPPNN